MRKIQNTIYSLFSYQSQMKPKPMEPNTAIMYYEKAYMNWIIEIEKKKI